MEASNMYRKNNDNLTKSAIYRENNDNLTKSAIYRENNESKVTSDIPIDSVTNFGKIYKTCDGKDVATMEEVFEYNHMYYERMMNRSQNPDEGMHR